MVTAVQRGRYSVYVYDETRAPRRKPHCHVWWPGGSAAVELLDLRVLVGANLSAAARALLEDHLTEIRAAWNRLNPERPIHEHRDPTSGAEGA